LRDGSRGISLAQPDASSMKRLALSTLLVLVLPLASLSFAACAPSVTYIQGTKIPQSDENAQLIKVVERYRQALERKDSAALLLMASKSYYEDGGTQTGSDDYGYEGLRDVLASRFLLAKNIRYSMRYVRIRRKGPRAFVEVFVDASFSLLDASGEIRREDIKDQNLLVLIQENERWKFVSGM